jgi:hypothetical protein
MRVLLQILLFDLAYLLGGQFDESWRNDET